MVLASSMCVPLVRRYATYDITDMNVHNDQISQDRFLSPRQLAVAIGVSESSLKRWADDGRLAVERTAGGHRRIPLPEAVRWFPARSACAVHV